MGQGTVPCPTLSHSSGRGSCSHYNTHAALLQGRRSHRTRCSRCRSSCSAAGRRWPRIRSSPGSTSPRRGRSRTAPTGGRRWKSSQACAGGEILRRCAPQDDRGAFAGRRGRRPLRRGRRAGASPAPTGEGRREKRRVRSGGGRIVVDGMWKSGIVEPYIHS